jgi:hypothetical protein
MISPTHQSSLHRLEDIRWRLEGARLRRFLPCGWERLLSVILNLKELQLFSLGILHVLQNNADVSVSIRQYRFESFWCAVWCTLKQQNFHVSFHC